MQGLQKEITAEVMGAWEGRTAPVLVEGPSRKDPDWLSGRISQNWIVNFPGADRLVGEVVDVEVERAFSNSLLGRLPTRETVAGGGRLNVIS